MRHNRFSLLAVLLIIFVWVFMVFNIAKWHKLGVINHDVVSYYSYLPAAFIYRDLTFQFTDKLPPDFEGKIWYLTTDEGARFQKMTMGLALLYLPFFLLGHLHASLGGFPATGYSMPYELYLALSGVFYASLGIVVLRNLLIRYFSDAATALTLLSLAFATNLLYYTTSEPAMSHAYSFFLFAVFMNLSIRWHQRADLLNTLLLGVAGGFITLVRPVNALVFLIPLLLGLEHFRKIPARFLFFFRKWKMLLILLFVACAMFLPQLFYWKYATGQWLFYSYGNEGFFFDDPQIFNGLFSYRKGWLVYAPVMIFSLAGFFFMDEKVKAFRGAIVLFFAVNVYVIFSWWCWWYGGSFGARTLIESYVFLALPMAAFYQYFWKKSIWVKCSVIFLLMGLITLNCIQTWQYRKAIIHWDGMTKEAYWAVFGKLYFPPDFDELIQRPDYEKAVEGARELK